MKTYRNMLGIAAIVGLAFAAGRLDIAPAGSTAMAQDEPAVAMPPELDEFMLAAMQAGMPGEHHEHLNQMIGTWDGEWKMWMPGEDEPMVATGTIIRTWILDGRYVREEVEAISDMGTFQGLGFLGYSNIDGQYEATWMDSMSTSIMKAAGFYDADTKALRMWGQHRDAEGKMKRGRSESDLSDPNVHYHVEWVTGPDGQEYKAFEGVATKRN